VDDLIVASEALAAGLVTRQLRTKFVKLHHNVYARKGIQLDAADKALELRRAIQRR
jgi:hypothetical protein